MAIQAQNSAKIDEQGGSVITDGAGLWRHLPRPLTRAVSGYDRWGPPAGALAAASARIILVAWLLAMAVRPAQASPSTSVATVPLLFGIAETALEWFGLRELSGVVLLLAAVIYGKHLLTAGRMAGNVVRYLLVAGVVVVALTLVGVIPELRFGEVVALADDLAAVIQEVMA